LCKNFVAFTALALPALTHLKARTLAAMPKKDFRRNGHENKMPDSEKTHYRGVAAADQCVRRSIRSRSNVSRQRPTYQWDMDRAALSNAHQSNLGQFAS
jgi:hypothetical protein